MLHTKTLINVQYRHKLGQCYNQLNTVHTDELKLSVLFFIFLKIGSLAFGGYMALISAVESVIVNKRKLISTEEMLNAVSLANILPGPIAVNVVAAIGYKLRGSLGALVTTIAVITPSFLLVCILSYAYFEFGHITDIQSLFKGILPAIAAIVLSMVWRMGKNTLKNSLDITIMICAAGTFLIVPQDSQILVPVLITLSCIYIGLLRTDQVYTLNIANIHYGKHSLIIGGFILLAFFSIIPLNINPNSILMLVITLSSMSLILFGGGYVFIPVIGAVVVSQYQWLSQQEFIDGIAMGQLTPGPILISATFIGYKLAGILGAFFATLSIFAPPALLMIYVSNHVYKFEQNKIVQTIMHNLHCGVIGMMSIASLIILRTALPESSFNHTQSWICGAIFITALIGLIKLKLDILWVIPSAGLLGYLFL